MTTTLAAVATHYEVLGVKPDATPEAVRAAWLQAARRHHPDSLGDVGPAARRRATSAMAEINEAWRVLGSPAKRATYDEQLAAESAARARAASAGGRDAGPPSERERGAHGSAQGDPSPTHPDEPAWPDEAGSSWDASPREGGLGGFVVRNRTAATVLRVLPWLLLALIGVVIFIFSAFAGGRDPAPPSELGCVAINDEGQLNRVPCDRRNDGEIDQIIGVSPGSECRDPNARSVAVAANRRYCIVPHEP